jgi:hypothetical protein
MFENFWHNCNICSSRNSIKYMFEVLGNVNIVVSISSGAVLR